MALEYWEYFLSIESDLEKCARYVDFSSNNYDTNSVEFARVIMAAAAEVDTIAKELCKLIDPQANAGNICQYASTILTTYPNLVNVEMSINRYDVVVKPWDGWSNSSSPSWWQGYNKIKHDRTANFDRANLVNAISAVAGLLLILLYYFKKKNGGKTEEISAFYSPKILDVVDSRPSGGWTNGGVFWGYYLP
jgi:hypothetical protein